DQKTQHQTWNHRTRSLCSILASPFWSRKVEYDFRRMNTLTQRALVKSSPPKRTIGLVTACSVVIANIIGTGIFTSLGFQLNNIQSGFALLMLWVIGGVAALCGAL